MENFESAENKKEREKYTSEIKLFFFRHGEKDKEKRALDSEIKISPDGKIKAIEKGKEINPEQSIATVAFGSSKKRTAETASLVASGSNPEITGEETLEELTLKLDKELTGVGSKSGTDKRLDFSLDEESEFGKISQSHMKGIEKGGSRDYLKFLVEESDELAEELGDKSGPTYLRMTSNIAGIVNKYLTIAPRWDKIAKNNKDEYADALMKRFLSSHTGVLESFLAKIIEKTRGEEEVRKFIEAVNDQGFDKLEGFNVEILSKDSGDADICIYYKKEGEQEETVFEFNEIVSPKIIRDLIIKAPPLQKHRHKVLK